MATHIGRGREREEGGSGQNVNDSETDELFAESSN